MSPKRGDRAAPPATGSQWGIRFASADAASGWELLCKQAPGPTHQAWRLLRDQPRPDPHTRRQHPLLDDLAHRTYRGRELEQWQYEVTGAGRIWYLVDDERHTVWLTLVTADHPKTTE
jgi:hypothetical protein